MPAVQLCIGDIHQVRAAIQTDIDALLSHVSYDAYMRGTHYHLLWIALSGRQHRREDIQSVFDVTQYKRSKNDPYVIVIEYADCLTNAAANSMLKLLEEPPHGYYIFLLAESEDAVLPTVRSRTYIRRFISSDTVCRHPLYRMFTHVDGISIQELHAVLQDDVPSEYMTRIILQSLLAFWMAEYRSAAQHHIHHRMRNAQRILDIIRDAIRDVPLSGNVKMFWRTFACHLMCIQEGSV